MIRMGIPVFDSGDGALVPQANHSYGGVACTLVEMPSLRRSDSDVLSEYRGRSYSEEDIAEHLWPDFEKAFRGGGLQILNYRTDRLGSRSHRSPFLRAIEGRHDPSTNLGCPRGWALVAPKGTD